MAPALRPYPWGAFERVTRASIDAGRTLRLALADRIDLAQIAARATAMLGVPVGLEVRSITPGAALGDGVTIVLTEGTQGVAVRLEDPLAIRLVGAVLGEAPGWVDPRRRPPADVLGAASAFVVALARKSSAGVPWRLGAAPPVGRVVTVKLVAVVGDDAFDADVTLALPAAPAERPFTRGDLARLGAVPLTAPIVAATLVVTRAEANALTTGSALVLGPAFRLERGPNGLAGPVTIADPRSEIAIAATVRGDGDVIAQPGPVSLPWSDAGDAADVVIRAEIGSITLAARAWAEVSPGDALARGVGLGGDVVLRGNGEVVARGELVSLRDDVAVRVK